MKEFLLKTFRELGFQSEAKGLENTDRIFLIKTYARILKSRLNYVHPIVSQDRIEEIKDEFEKEIDKWDKNLKLINWDGIKNEMVN